MASAYQRPVYRFPTQQLIAAPATPGRPAVNVASVQQHATAGACGCGAKHSAPAAFGGAPGSSGDGAVELGPSFNVHTTALVPPAGAVTPAQPWGFNVDFLSKIDWPNDWWKFALGALAYKVLLK